MTEKTSCEIFLAINEDGDYEVRTDETDATEALVENFGGTMVRVVKITALVKAPVRIEATVDVPDDVGETEKVDIEA